MNIVKQKIRIFKFLDRQIDLILILSSLYLSLIFARYYVNGEINPSLILTNQTLINFSMLILCYLLFLSVFEYKVHYRSTKSVKYISKLLLVSYLSIFSFTIGSYMLETYFFSMDFIARSEIDLMLVKPHFLIVFSFLAFLLLLLKRVFMKALLSVIREAGFDTKNIMIIGNNSKARKLVKEFSIHQEYGFKIKSIVDPYLKKKEESIFKSLNLETDITNIRRYLIKESIDEIFITINPKKILTIDKDLFTYLDYIGVSYHVCIDTGESKLQPDLKFKVLADEYYGMQMLSYHSINANLYELAIKDFIEKILALILILITLPISFISSILIKLTSNGPVFFRQKRVGLRGRRFSQYKFRSMEVNAEIKQKEIMHMNEQSGPVFKVKNDPRVTSIGKIIRKFSIDELPQLINVLKGNMSLIGPRPLPVYEVEKFDSDTYFRRHSMKPGITGLWQVSGRNSIQNFNDWVKIDLNYIDNWSFWLDFKIAFKTFFVIISGSGK